MRADHFSVTDCMPIIHRAWLIVSVWTVLPDVQKGAIHARSFQLQEAGELPRSIPLPPFIRTLYTIPGPKSSAWPAVHDHTQLSILDYLRPTFSLAVLQIKITAKRTCCGAASTRTPCGQKGRPPPWGTACSSSCQGRPLRAADRCALMHGMIAYTEPCSAPHTA